MYINIPIVNTKLFILTYMKMVLLNNIYMINYSCYTLRQLKSYITYTKFPKKHLFFCINLFFKSDIEL